MPVFKHDEAQWLVGCPDFVIGQGRGCDHSHSVVGIGDLTKVDFEIAVDQVRLFEWVCPDDVLKLGRAVREQCLPVGHQHVECAMPGDFHAGVAQDSGHFFGRRPVVVSTLAECVFQGLQKQAEGLFAVGVADREEVSGQFRPEVFQIAVVCKHPGLSPQFANKRVAIGQFHPAHRGFSNVGNDVFGPNRVAANQLCHGRVGGGFVVDETPRRGFLEECYAPSIGVLIRKSAAFGEAFK